MKKIGLLNQPLSGVIAGLGHLDTLVIADAGLPIPAQTQRIDLAVSANVPSFLEVLRATLEEMQVEGAIVAEEMLQHSPATHEAITALLGKVPIQKISHNTFKMQTHHASAVVRTGEFTPYANVILIAGVVF